MGNIEGLDPVMAALIGLVVLVINGLIELVKYSFGKNARKNGSGRNGAFTADDREKLTELRIYQKQQLDETKEQTSLLTEMRDSLRLLSREDNRGPALP